MPERRERRRGHQAAAGVMPPQHVFPPDTTPGADRRRRRASIRATAHVTGEVPDSAPTRAPPATSPTTAGTGHTADQQPYTGPIPLEGDPAPGVDRNGSQPNAPLLTQDGIRQNPELSLLPATTRCSFCRFHSLFMQKPTEPVAAPTLRTAAATLCPRFSELRVGVGSDACQRGM